MAWTRGDISADLIPKFSFLGCPCWQKKHWQQQPPWLYEVSCAGKKLQLSGTLTQIFKQPAAPEKFENSLSEGKLGCSSLWDQQVVKSHPFTSDTGREVLSVLQRSQISVFALIFLMQAKSHGLAFSTGMRCLSIFVGCGQSEFWASQNHRWLRTPCTQNPVCGSPGKDRTKTHRSRTPKRAVIMPRGFYGFYGKPAQL